MTSDSMVDGDWLPARLRLSDACVICGLSTRVGRRRKFCEVSCMVCTVQGNDFELIPTVKMETRNPGDGYFASEFPAV